MTIHDFRSPAKRTTILRSPDELVVFEKELRRGGDAPAFLLFIEGHPTPLWLATIGYLFQVDPVFFIQHMDYMTSSDQRDYFRRPPLPQWADNVIRLGLTTTGIRLGDPPSGQSAIQAAREQDEKQMADYLRDVQSGRGLSAGH